MDVLVFDLPYATSKTHIGIKNRLKKLSENCGGKVVTLQGQFALVRFPNKEAALRYENESMQDMSHCFVPYRLFHERMSIANVQ